ncbi:MAG TPA: glycerate kinase [Propionibacteriaceae bacterium]|jgi:glycerate kinase|nr:glycerate kinase [Propionibacteriaceae bacterium]
MRAEPVEARPSTGSGGSRVVLAPDKFKGCLPAAEVAAAVARGVRSARPEAETVLVPVADGGDGTVAAAVSAGWSEVVVDAVGPTGERVRAAYARLGHRAVVELAEVVGLDRLPDRRLDPLGASTFGLGLVIREAVAAGATEIVLGLGGSASTDGGAGMVQALGARLDAPTRLLDDVRVTVATDVDSPLLGPMGAAAVFGPQKGASPEQVAVLEDRLTRWAEVVAEATGRDLSGTPGAGAAGGTGFAALALLGATVRPGIEVVLELVGFAERVAGADLVVTGEGSLDAQSLAGKAPIGVARATAAYGVPVVAVAGRRRLADADLQRAGIAAAYPLSDLEPDPAQSIARAAELLEVTGSRIAEAWLR